MGASGKGVWEWEWEGRECASVGASGAGVWEQVGWECVSGWGGRSIEVSGEGVWEQYTDGVLLSMQTKEQKTG